MAQNDNQTQDGLDQQGQDQQDRTSATVTTENNYQQWWFLAGGLAILIIFALLLYFFVFNGESKDLNKTNAPVTVVDSTVTSDSTLQKQVDSLLSEFNNFKSKTSARLDSLEAPMWFRKLDQDAASGGNK